MQAIEPGQIERYDCEYKRNGTANLFVFLDVNRPCRKVKVTERRAAEDFAACMRDLTDLHFPGAERIRVVLDNLSTHSAGALHRTKLGDAGARGADRPPRRCRASRSRRSPRSVDASKVHKEPASNLAKS